MNDAIEQIKTEALALSDGETVTSFCFFCKAEHESKLAITRTSDGLLFICPRASCGAKGFIPDHNDGAISYRRTKRPEFIPKPFTEMTEKPPDWLYKYMHDKYELEEYDLMINGVSYATTSGRVVFNAATKEGERWGQVVKDEFHRRSKRASKSYTYPLRPNIGLYYPVSRYRNTIVVVEDPISAMKMSKVCPAVALLGTTFNDEQALDIAKVAESMVFALDPDATDKALEYQKRYSLLLKTSALILPQDVKDTPLAQLKEWYQGGLHGGKNS